MTDALLSVEQLGVRFGAARVLEDVNLEIASGEIVGLVGPNGAGKTTTLRAISGLVACFKGRISLGGQLLPSDPEAIARMGITHVPEGRGLVPSLTVRQNLRLALSAIGVRYETPHWDYVTSIFPALARLSERQAGLLSGGEQQMVAIARGLVVRPTVLMIDELSLGLAPKIVQNLLATLKATVSREKLTVLLVDQNVRALSRMCARLYSLNFGCSSVTALHDESVYHSIYFGAAGQTPPLVENNP